MTVVQQELHARETTDDQYPRHAWDWPSALTYEITVDTRSGEAPEDGAPRTLTLLRPTPNNRAEDLLFLDRVPRATPGRLTSSSGW
ncbi:hypothetical protein ACFV0Y_24700 [Streptomyces sp. NPDC059569]|uniref:hypothetical protein n=1 Tax=Streptomyces sp. NPDC059569 TaxID=3346869 RepID=UPI00368F560C